jgi:hypothetical protein
MLSVGKPIELAPVRTADGGEGLWSVYLLKDTLQDLYFSRSSGRAAAIPEIRGCLPDDTYPQRVVRQRVLVLLIGELLGQEPVSSTVKCRVKNVGNCAWPSVDGRHRDRFRTAAWERVLDLPGSRPRDGLGYTFLGLV